MDWKQPELLNKEAISENGFINPEYSIPCEWIHIHYYETANILFRFENAFRVLVYTVLKKQYGNEWSNIKVNQDKTVNQVYKERLALNNKHGYLGQPVSSPMLFLNSGELTYILDSEKSWAFFRQYFKADRSVIVNKLHEINSIRNSFAHFRPINEDDLTLLKLNISHVFFNAVDFFENLYNQHSDVPSNLKEAWYQKLANFESPNTNLFFTRSKNESWISAVFTFKLPIVGGNTPTSSNFAHIKTTQIRLDRLLKKFNSLVAHTIFISDNLSSLPPPNQSADLPLSVESGDFIHSIKFVFSRSTINKEHEAIVDAFKSLAETVENDIEVIDCDNCAEGEVLVPYSFYLHRIHDKWDYSSFKKSYNNNIDDSGIVEYWGNTYGTFMNPVSDLSKIPWIKGQISSANYSF
ncbi:hypothetical protein F0247_23060 [Vibrio crassostreae]|uniref:hypothetical protein n=1 Tax=Vibrio crassostreae TaxID=246167 RepID=UPI00148B43B9|nr:hypothetical protein [Vibrio crassostreae]NOH77900.1 hypothetical protein [Vibrio crassostreae]